MCTHNCIRTANSQSRGYIYMYIYIHRMQSRQQCNMYIYIHIYIYDRKHSRDIVYEATSMHVLIYIYRLLLYICFSYVVSTVTSYPRQWIRQLPVRKTVLKEKAASFSRAFQPADHDREKDIVPRPEACSSSGPTEGMHVCSDMMPCCFRFVWVSCDIAFKLSTETNTM